MGIERNLYKLPREDFLSLSFMLFSSERRFGLGRIVRG